MTAKTHELVLPSYKRTTPPFPIIPAWVIPIDSDIERAIRFVVGTTTTSSTGQTVAGSVVNQAVVQVTQAYSAGATLQISVGATVILATSFFPVPIGIETYVDFPDLVLPGGPVTATVGGGPVAGSAIVAIQFSTPSG